ncbi:hypothetical protein [Methylobacterium durans]|uniref:Prolyl 4-hydroxylase alpha subunit Fe(2+) 2OG dioxygenase domain-containing protein n=1 Tax=Methylobacterium durans TaxID=2202825 RepID=A0A2U8W7C4_9HYPH|nr:hypothetical protein [Methylobacterium durans]AWN41206.1 hypothetical protein DK389_12575 [Methylobacterium durans]
MFAYLIRKLRDAPVSDEPFRHVSIEDFFSDEHFGAITSAAEIAIGRAEDDQGLIEALHAAGYREINFPGTTTDLASYIAWHAKRDLDVPENGAMTNRDLCEGVGVTLRLQSARTALIGDLMTFLRSDAWLDAIAAKFAIDRAAVYADGGIQKYLDGYEISPHADIRAKALTYMVNINPSDRSADIDYHTHYMRFRREKAYVQAFWNGNPDLDRCWVPWSWCETVKRQTRNNTIVLFQPADDTLHAVRARYDHLETQRTQLYGNLWFHRSRTTGKPSWSDFDVRARIGAA